MRGSVSTANCERPRPNTRILWSVAILLTLGLCLDLFASEWYGAFDTHIRAAMDPPFSAP